MSMDTYQPIYDAVCQRIGHPDVSGTIDRVVREQFDISWLKSHAQDVLHNLQANYERPFIMLRPSMSIDGNQWCALYGENLQDGVAGFGESPHLASVAFDKAWNEKQGGKA